MTERKVFDWLMARNTVVEGEPEAQAGAESSEQPGAQAGEPSPEGSAAPAAE